MNAYTDAGHSAAATSGDAVPGTLPYLRIHRSGRAEPTGLVLLLHGGRDHSREAVRAWSPAPVRMRLLVGPLLNAGAAAGVAVAVLRDRYQGWNGAAADPVRDARWALDQLAASHAGLPVVLVGHSMGARAALRATGHPAVTAVAALAPWVPPGEPVEQLAGRTVLLAHADRDRVTSAADSLEYAARAREVAGRVARLRVDGGDHAMLRRFGDWQHLVTGFALAALGAGAMPPAAADAFAAPVPQGIDFPLPRGGVG